MHIAVRRIGSAVLAASLYGTVAQCAATAPFVPRHPDDIVEQLPAVERAAAWRELKALRARLANTPEDLDLALEVARRFSELGRASGDPRYAGYAESALAPWWNQDPPPVPVAVLRAILRQRMHRFDAALADLSAVLRVHPGHGQARLTRASIRQVRGEFAAARADCLALRGHGPALLWVTCVAGVDGMSGRLQETYETLLGALRHAPAVTDRSIRSWTLTALADMAERLGRSEWAEDHLRAALELDGEDAYVLAVYADFLLANDRAKEALVLLEGRTRTDPLLLRHALALQARGSRGAKSAIAALGARFEASRKRGDRVHLREEARYALELRHDPEAALALALENWPVQKEPADLRLLVRAARAAGDREALRMAADWMAQTGYEDAVVAPLLGAAR